MAREDAAQLTPETPLPWRDDDPREYVHRIELHHPESLEVVTLDDNPVLNALKHRLHISTGRELSEEFATALAAFYGDFSMSSFSIDSEVDRDVALALTEIDFDGIIDDRRSFAQAWRAIREDRQRFRRLVIEHDEGRCVATGSNDRETLQAAHISPYMGKQSNRLENGLTLRSDIHTLFDRHLLTFAEENGSWILRTSPRLMSKEYRSLDGTRIDIARGMGAPSKELLIHHSNQCHWLSQH